MAAMLAIIRPMNESTISSDEMSISTPAAPVCDDLLRQIVLQRHRQPVVHVHLDGDEQELAHPQDRNAFHAGPQATAGWLSVDASSRVRFSASANASASVALVVTPPQVDAEMDDRLRDLRPDAADDAVRAHQPGGRDRLQQMLRDQRVHGRHAGDVDDRDLGAGLDDPLQQRSPSRPACARCRACRSSAARGRRPTA